MTTQNLDKESIKTLISATEVRSVEVIAPKAVLTKLVDNKPNIEHGTMWKNPESKEEERMRLPRGELLRELQKLDNEATPSHLQFEDINNKLADAIVDFCPADTVFVCSFTEQKGIELSKDQGQVLEEQLSSAKVSLSKLNVKLARIFIKLLRRYNFEFQLEFQRLTFKQTERIVEKANLEQEDVQVMAPKDIKDLFMKTYMPTNELEEFRARGIEYILVVNEKNFVPWRSVGWVVAIGVFLMAFGGALICTGFGATVGMGLVTEGIADVFLAYRAFSNRQFRWDKDEFQQQARIRANQRLSIVKLMLKKIKENQEMQSYYLQAAVAAIAAEEPI
jgi:hypothetical protein